MSRGKYLCTLTSTRFEEKCKIRRFGGMRHIIRQRTIEQDYSKTRKKYPTPVIFLLIDGWPLSLLGSLIYMMYNRQENLFSSRRGLGMIDTWVSTGLGCLLWA